MNERWASLRALELRVDAIDEVEELGRLESAFDVEPEKVITFTLVAPSLTISPCLVGSRRRAAARGLCGALLGAFARLARRPAAASFCSAGARSALRFLRPFAR